MDIFRSQFPFFNLVINSISFDMSRKPRMAMPKQKSRAASRGNELPRSMEFHLPAHFFTLVRTNLAHSSTAKFSYLVQRLEQLSAGSPICCLSLASPISLITRSEWDRIGSQVLARSGLPRSLRRNKRIPRPWGWEKWASKETHMLECEGIRQRYWHSNLDYMHCFERPLLPSRNTKGIENFFTCFLSAIPGPAATRITANTRFPLWHVLLTFVQLWFRVIHQRLRLHPQFFFHEWLHWLI